MTTSTTDYLRFSAYSIKDLIVKKLTSDSKFTDQVYEGSNLAILIDIVSYMYQCLMYNVNNAAAESMFSDTQIYENINRLCKFIGYNPKGCSTSTAIFSLTNNIDSQFTDINIPAYSAIDTGKVSKDGKKVYYSVVYDSTKVTVSDNYEILTYNGLWKLYSTVFSGTGQSYQTLTLTGLKSDYENSEYIPNKMIDVWVQVGDADPDKWTYSDQGLFVDNDITTKSVIYNGNNQIYNVRLNEDKTYEVSFGNNYTGKIPPKNSKIYIMYLDSNGPDGELDPGEIIDGKIVNSAEMFGISETLHKQLTGIDDDQVLSKFKTLSDGGRWMNKNASTTSTAEESVDYIRRNAPEWFKTGNRLVTTQDWEYYIKNSQFGDNILDVKCQNNWQYISTFYRWLYNLGLKNNNPKKYLNQSRLSKDAQYSDASDVNNVYLWIKMKDQQQLYTDNINNDIQNIKMITQEPVYLTPLNVHFSICAQEAESARKEYFNDDNTITEFDPNNKSYLEVTIDDNILYSAQDVQFQIAKMIMAYFDETNFTLGQIVNYNDLASEILSYKQISKLRTVYHDNETGEERIINGISFATWTEGFIDLGDDLEVSNTTKALEPFQFPVLDKSKLLQNKIKVIKKAINSVNTIQY